MAWLFDVVLGLFPTAGRFVPALVDLSVEPAGPELDTSDLAVEDRLGAEVVLGITGLFFVLLNKWI
jgi:hypothetical protein